MSNTASSFQGKIKLIVIDDHTLGYTIPGYSRPVAGVLRASIIKGSFHKDGDTVFLKGRKVRLATEKDFDAFRVSSNGYRTDAQYIYRR